MKVLILVVLYNRKPRDSETIVGLNSLSHVLGQSEVLVWINSSVWGDGDANELAELLRDYCVSIRHTPENTPLSRIYNLIFDEHRKTDRIFIFDHDTILSEEYFKEVLERARISDDLILPQVFSGGRLVSPGRRFISKGYLRKFIRPGVHFSKNMLAINSGMAICPRSVGAIRWDERLRFYGTDTQFMYQYEKIRDFVFVTSAALEHKLSIDQNPTDEWRRKFASEMVRCNGIIYAARSERLFNVFFNFWIQVRTKMGSIARKLR